MKLFFQNSNGNERIIAEVESWAKAYECIKDFCSERDFKIPYVRLWNENKRLWADVGSHTEFFILEPYTLDDVYEEQEQGE